MFVVSVCFLIVNKIVYMEIKFLLFFVYGYWDNLRMLDIDYMIIICIGIY